MVRRVCTFGVFIIATLLAGPLQSSEFAAIGELEGDYEAVRSDEQARERINRQLNTVIEKMTFYKKPFARSKLRNATVPCPSITIRDRDDEVSVQCGDDRPAVSPVDGTETEYTNRDEESYTLSQQVESERIVQVFESENGTRTNVYMLEDDDTLLLSVTVEGEQLPEPITYQRRFERQS